MRNPGILEMLGAGEGPIGLDPGRDGFSRRDAETQREECLAGSAFGVGVGIAIGIEGEQARSAGLRPSYATLRLRAGPDRCRFRYRPRLRLPSVLSRIVGDRPRCPSSLTFRVLGRPKRTTASPGINQTVIGTLDAGTIIAAQGPVGTQSGSASSMSPSQSLSCPSSQLPKDLFSGLQGCTMGSRSSQSSPPQASSMNPSLSSSRLSMMPSQSLSLPSQSSTAPG